MRLPGARAPGVTVDPRSIEPEVSTGERRRVGETPLVPPAVVPPEVEPAGRLGFTPRLIVGVLGVRRCSMSGLVLRSGVIASRFAGTTAGGRREGLVRVGVVVRVRGVSISEPVRFTGVLELVGGVTDGLVREGVSVGRGCDRVGVDVVGLFVVGLLVVVGRRVVVVRRDSFTAGAREAVGREFVGREVVGREVVGRVAVLVVGRDAVGRDALGLEVVGREVVGREVLGRGAALGAALGGAFGAGRETAFLGAGRLTGLLVALLVCLGLLAFVFGGGKAEA